MLMTVDFSRVTKVALNVFCYSLLLCHLISQSRRAVERHVSWHRSGSLQLEEPLAYNHQIKPISLASMTDHYDATHSTAVVTGWGALRSSGSSTNQLRKVEVPLVSDTECSSLYENRKITSRMLCAGNTNVGGKDACQVIFCFPRGRNYERRT